MTNEIKVLLKFLQLDTCTDLKSLALESLLGLTTNEEGIKLIMECKGLLVALISLLHCNDLEIVKNSTKALINISASQIGAEQLLTIDKSVENLSPLQNAPEPIINILLKLIFLEKKEKIVNQIADNCCMVLANLAQLTKYLNEIIDLIESNESYKIEKIIELLNERTNKSDRAQLHYLASFLSNLTQNQRARQIILNEKDELIKYLIPYIDNEDSLIRQTGIIGTIRNCCFETKSHEYLLNNEINLLPYLLLPLAGNEKFDAEECDKLPIELRYLGKGKLRIDNADNRLMLIETLMQLCTEKKNREFIRNRNVYVILRELHKWERDERVLTTLEDLVNILIRTEEEIGVGNLKDDVEIPFQNVMIQ